MHKEFVKLILEKKNPVGNTAGAFGATCGKTFKQPLEKFLRNP